MDLSSNILLSLGAVALRTLALVLVALAAIVIFRLKSAASRHAVWTIVTAGMLVLVVCEPLLPPLPLRVLKPVADAAPVALPTPSLPLPAAGPAPIAPSARTPISWPQVGLGLYAVIVLAFLTRLAFGYLFTLRLLRASTPIDRPWAVGIHESSWISVPLTLGWLRPKILLPLEWEEWDGTKLDAVLAHERTHISRADWAITLMAGINRAIFWFHPLAWWLERHLAMLAEQACDDAALQLVDTAPYAQALLDMAAAVKTRHGRLVWEAMAMANVAEVKRRIERILDETRQIPRGLSRKGWAALLGASLPLIYIASVLQLAPAEAQQPSGPTPAIIEMLKSGHTLSASEAAALEQYLQATTNDVPARTQLILYYYNAGVRQPRLNHIFWLISNRPDSTQALFTSRGITPRTSSFNDSSDFTHAANLWKQQAAAQPDNAQVVGNAVDFLSQPGGDVDEAERLARQARQHSTNDVLWAQKLARIYSSAILGTSGDPRFPDLNAAFAARVRTELETSQDKWVLQFTGGTLASVARRPTDGKPLAGGVLNLDDHPLLISAVDLGNHYLARARELGAVPPMPPIPAGATPTVRTVVPRDVMPQNAAPAPTLANAPTLISKTDPVYPPLAMQARIQGTVKLMATISTDGHLQHLQVMSGHPLLVPAALEAVKNWVYAPISSAGNIEIDVPFTLPPGSTPPNPSAQGKAFMAPGNGIPTIRIGGGVQSAKLVHKVDPVYPQAAKDAGVEGPVVLDVTIGTDGKVQSALAKEGSPLLATAAIQAVLQYEYQPTLLNDAPCVVITSVTVDFQ